ncbi:hypothetical protein Ahy_B03g065911 [Arachis hypogaea]|uniref:Zinc finger GRF-type domain-containing protein n=1 Tax=Arachis hypogaea TaxID=3818 RepID=A0A445A2V8_ARAHY|nr:hypothetical protein Ahy_B03g065911 [Arachis hypogaea]
MASQGFVSSQKISRQRRMLTCNCDEPPVLRWSKTPKNPSRRFWGYVYFDIGKECTFFSWADGVAETEEAEVARLKMKISTLKAKLVYAKCKLLVAVIFGVLVGLSYCDFNVLFVGKEWNPLEIKILMCLGLLKLAEEPVVISYLNER